VSINIFFFLPSEWSDGYSLLPQTSDWKLKDDVLGQKWAFKKPKGLKMS